MSYSGSYKYSVHNLLKKNFNKSLSSSLELNCKFVHIEGGNGAVYLISNINNNRF